MCFHPVANEVMQNELYCQIISCTFCSCISGVQASIKTAEVSTQTEMLASNLEMTGLPQNTCLPDLLVTSSSSLKVLPPPPPPPPPPAPPLPLKLQTAGATSTLSVTKRKQNALKKSQVRHKKDQILYTYAVEFFFPCNLVHLFTSYTPD